MSKPQLLLHTCCGPCAAGVYEELEKEGWEVTFLFYNPNIHPYDEYCRREENFYRYMEITGQKGITPFPYQPADYFQSIISETNRCSGCYRLRLKKVAEWGEKNSFQHFTTTLTISPYQNQENIFLIGEQIANNVDMIFLKRNFQPLYRNSRDRSIELNLYRQKYCGCLFSLWEGDKKRLWKYLFGQKPL